MLTRMFSRGQETFNQVVLQKIYGQKSIGDCSFDDFILEFGIPTLWPLLIVTEFLWVCPECNRIDY